MVRASLLCEYARSSDSFRLPANASRSTGDCAAEERLTNEFLPYALEILAQEDVALAVMSLSKAAPTGTLRFPASSTFAQLYSVPIIPGFLGRYPGINVDMRLTDMQFDLIAGSFDLAVRNSVMEVVA